MPTEERSYPPVFITIIYLMAERGVRSYRAAKALRCAAYEQLVRNKGGALCLQVLPLPLPFPSAPFAGADEVL
jgi:hypothetical protein